MSATASSLLQDVPGTPDTAPSAEIRRVFELHAVSTRRLRVSTVEQRIARLKRLRQVLLAHRGPWSRPARRISAARPPRSR